MSKPFHRRPIRAAAALLFCVWVEGCFAYTPVRPGGELKPSTSVHVRSASPFMMSAPATAFAPAVPPCRSTLVDGRVTRVSGDTIMLQGVSRVVSAPDAAGRGQCPRFTSGVAVLVRDANTQVATSQLRIGRTLGLVVITTTVLLIATAKKGGNGLGGGIGSLGRLAR